MTETAPPRAPELTDTRVTYFVGDSGARLTVHPDVAPILIGFAVDFHESVETLDPAQCYGDERGDGIHLNWRNHNTEATYSTRQIMTIGRLMDKWSLAGRSLLWWGTAGTPPRRAHFLIDVERPVCQEAIALLCRPLPTGVTALRPIPYAGPLGSRTLRMRTPRMRGEDVRFVQQALYAAGHKDAHADGPGERYGPHTEAVVRRFQDENGLEPDGVVGPATWAALLR